MGRRVGRAEELTGEGVANGGDFEGSQVLVEVCGCCCCWGCFDYKSRVRGRYKCGCCWEAGLGDCVSWRVR
jgi:hypothetical protein